MKWIKRLLYKRTPDADLNAESSRAGSFYMRKTGLTNLEPVDRQRILNAAAAGFHMGWRKHEQVLRGEDD